MSYTGDPIPSSPEAQFAAWKQMIERRLRNLEASPSLPVSSSKAGRLRLLDPSDTAVGYFGLVGSGLEEWHAMQVRDVTDKPMISTRSDKDGIIQPDIPIPWARWDNFFATTSSTFVIAYAYDPREAYHDVLRCGFVITKESADSMEVRLRQTNAPNAISTDAVTIGSGITTKRVLFEWLHTHPLGDDAGGNPNFVLEARRSAGTAGAVNVYEPDEAHWTSSALVPAANAQGAPQVF